MTEPHLPCLLCNAAYSHPDTLLGHYREHSASFDSALAVYGIECPACPRVIPQRLTQHASRVHERQIALLFEDVKRAGDHRGVVTRRINYLLDAWLSELEQAAR